jgi:hypothetical protein
VHFEPINEVPGGVDSSRDALVEMVVRCNETRNYDHASRINGLPSGRCDPITDRDDVAI